MRQATITDTDGDHLLIHGTPEALFLTVRAEDGTRTAGGFTRAQLDALLDTVAPLHADPGPCGRSSCWKEDGHDGPCEPSGRPHPDAEGSRPLTAREHLDAAWDAAHTPEDGMIPAETEYIVRFSPGTYAVRKTGADPVSAESAFTRRLLAPPEAVGAAEQLRVLLAAYGDQDEDADDYEGRLSVYLARHGVRVEEEKR